MLRCQQYKLLRGWKKAAPLMNTDNEKENSGSHGSMSNDRYDDHRRSQDHSIYCRGEVVLKPITKIP